MDKQNIRIHLRAYDNKILDNSRLVISLESTLAYESLARGNRTIFFSIRSDSLKKFDMIGTYFPISDYNKIVNPKKMLKPY